MTQMIFINLPVTDLDKAIAFYKGVGAEQNLQFSDETAAMMSFSQAINVMLLTHEKYRQFTSKPIADAHATSEVMLALSAEDRGAVDALTEQAGASGGRMDPNPKQDYGFTYGRSFEDPDGHIWEVVWMDVDAATQPMGSEPASAAG